MKIRDCWNRVRGVGSGSEVGMGLQAQSNAEKRNMGLGYVGVVVVVANVDAIDIESVGCWSYCQKSLWWNPRSIFANVRVFELACKDLNCSSVRRIANQLVMQFLTDNGDNDNFHPRVLVQILILVVSNLHIQDTPRSKGEVLG